MKIGYRAAGTVALLMLLSACGGGSGGVNSTPTPPSPSPTPTPTGNSTLTNLTVSQNFVNDAATLSGNWDVPTGTAIDGAARRGTLTIHYDAAARSYALTTDTRNTTLGTADVISQDAYDIRYRQSGGGNSQTLTLVKQPYSSTSGETYVAMGFWQSSSVTNGRQATDFTMFTYGLPTAASSVPRTGSGAYGIDVFGLVTKPGEEPMSFQGAGKFSVDFARGIFTTQASVEENGLVTDNNTIGGGIELRAGGSLSSSAETFAGNAVYGSYYGQSSGTIAGRFYGPGAQEIGATFQTGNAAGMAAVGALVGTRDTALVPENQTLTGLVSEQQFTTSGGSVGGALNWLNPETFDYAPPSSDMLGGRFTINDKIAGKTNFTTYAKSGNSGYGDQQVVLELYKPGADNSELALTYASFGHWAGQTATARDYYFTYGFTTGNNFLAARTGTARYEGVVYGAGVNSSASTRYDVNGTSSFDVDFGAQSFGGALALTGTERTSGASVDFGRFDMAGTLAARNSSLEGTVRQGGGYVLGSVWANFYGADAQELAGTFYLNVPSRPGGAGEVGVQGAIVTTRR